MSSNFEIAESHRWIPALRAYVPSWYIPHADLTRPVTKDGKPVGRGFTVGDVLPTRRWAIDTDGTVLKQRDFEDLYLRYLSGYELGRSHDVRNDAIPTVEHYVSTTYREDIGWHEIGWSPYSTAPAKPEPKYNQQGELSEHYLRERDGIASEASRLRVLTEQLASGEITPEQFIARSGVKVVEVSTAKDEPAQEPVPAPALEAARCGKSVKAGYVANHERRCKACLAMQEQTAA